MRIITIITALVLCGSPALAQTPVSIASAKTITDALAVLDGRVDGLEAAPINGTPALAALADNTSNPTTTGIAAYLMCWDATNWDRCQFGPDGSHGSAVAVGGPRAIAEATSSLILDTNVSDGQDTRIKAGLDGVLIVRPFANAEDGATGTPVAITDGSSTSVVAAAGSGIRNYITDIECVNSSSTNVSVDIRDGTSGAVLWTMACPSTYGGNNRTFARPLRGSANTAVAADPSASASTITISMNGFKSKL